MRILELLNQEIPELLIEKTSHGWEWSFRCDESEQVFDSPLRALIDFTAKTVRISDEMSGVNEDEEEDEIDPDIPF